MTPPWPKAVRAAAPALLAFAVAEPADAQLTLPPDDVWRQTVTAGLTSASGNSDSLALNLSAEAGVRNPLRKWLLYGRGVYGRNDDVTSTHNATLGVQGTREVGGPWFVFGGAEWFRDRPANLSWRLGVNGGPGYHLFRNGNDFWDVFAGIGHTEERYAVPTEVADQVRSRYGHVEALVGTEALIRLSDTTTWKQRFVVYPNLEKSGEYRASFDTSLAVAMTRSLAVTASLGARRNSEPGTGLRKNDLLVITGITYKSL